MLDLYSIVAHAAKTTGDILNKDWDADKPHYRILVEDYDAVITDYAKWVATAEGYAEGGAKTTLYSTYHKFNYQLYRNALYFILVKDRHFLEAISKEGKPYPLERVKAIIDGIKQKALEYVGNPKPISKDDVGKRVFIKGADPHNSEGIKKDYLVDEDLVEWIDGDVLYSGDEHRAMSEYLEKATESFIEKGKQMGYLA